VFLGDKSVSGPPNSIQSLEFRSPVQAASRLVFSALDPTEQRSEFQIQDLQITFLCLEKPFEFAPLYLFGRQLPRGNACHELTARP
jgi:hypothetical protein